MRKSLVGLFLLAGCGSTAAAPGPDLDGTYSTVLTPSGGTCGVGAETSSLQVQGTNVIAPAGVYTATRTGNVLSWKATLPSSQDTNGVHCTTQTDVTANVDFVSGEGSAYENVSVSCSDGTAENCYETFQVQATRQSH